MKNWIMMTLALMAFSLLPSPGTELGELCPVSVLAVETEGKQIRLSTDTMDVGVGETLDAALQNLRKPHPGTCFWIRWKIWCLLREAVFSCPS